MAKITPEMVSHYLKTGEAPAGALEILQANDPQYQIKKSWGGRGMLSQSEELSPASEKPGALGYLKDLAYETGQSLWEGTQSMGRAVGATADVYQGDGAELQDAAKAQAVPSASKHIQAFNESFKSYADAAGDSALGQIAAPVDAAIDNPRGAAMSIVQQAPNAVPSLAAGYVGMKAGAMGGAALGSVVPGLGTAAGGVIGGVLGGFAGMFIGNTAIETGHKGMEAAKDGTFTEGERSQVIKEGAVKGGVIAAIDVTTLGLSKFAMGTATRAIESATQRVLVDKGVDLADEAAVLAAKSNPDIVSAVEKAQMAAVKASNRLGPKLVRVGGTLGLETAGEGFGEYLGELAATGHADLAEASLEAFMGLGQSAAEMAFVATKNKAEAAAAMGVEGIKTVTAKMGEARQKAQGEGADLLAQEIAAAEAAAEARTARQTNPLADIQPANPFNAPGEQSLQSDNPLAGVQPVDPLSQQTNPPAVTGDTFTAQPAAFQPTPQNPADQALVSPETVTAPAQAEASIQPQAPSKADEKALGTTFKSEKAAKKALAGMSDPDAYVVQSLPGEAVAFGIVPDGLDPQARALQRQARDEYRKMHAITHNENGLRDRSNSPLSEEESTQAAIHSLQSSRLNIEAARITGKMGYQESNYASQLAKFKKNYPNVELPAELETVLQADRSSAPAGDAQTIKVDGEEKRVVLQNRDRSTPFYIGQMTKIAANPDYQRLSVTRDFGSGSPVVEPGADIPADRIGKNETATTGGGRKIPVTYAVVEAESLLASHNADGTENAGYQAGVPGQSRAIAGNGRIAGLQRAYGQGSAAEYRAGLEADAEGHGIRAEAIKGMKAPILVRIMPKDEITPNIGDESNISGTSTLSAAEQAENDSNRIDVSALEFTDDGRISETTARQFIQSMPEAERGALMDGGRPGKPAFDRLENVVFHTAYESKELTRLQSQATDPEARTVMSGLMMAAPAMAKLKGAGAWDIRPLITEAAEAAVNARRNGQTLQAYIEQGDISRNPAIVPIVQMMADNIRSAKRIGENLTRYAELFHAEASKPESDMFGEVERKPADQLLKEIGNERGSAEDSGDQRRPGADGENTGGQTTVATGQKRAEGDQGGGSQGFSLTQQTEEELAAKKEREQAEAGTAEADKAKADALVDNFGLSTGAATVSGGSKPEAPKSQGGDLFSSKPKTRGELKAEQASASAKSALAGITVKVPVTVQETGEKIEIEEQADAALADVDKRLEFARSLLECLAS